MTALDFELRPATPRRRVRCRPPRHAAAVESAGAVQSGAHPAPIRTFCACNCRRGTPDRHPSRRCRWFRTRRLRSSIESVSASAAQSTDRGFDRRPPARPRPSKAVSASLLHKSAAVKRGSVPARPPRRATGHLPKRWSPKGWRRRDFPTAQFLNRL